MDPAESGLSQRVISITESATLAITNKANQLRSEGVNVIGYGAGEPDFATPSPIVDAAIAAAQDPVNHKYSPAAGLPVLREAVAAKTLRDSGYEVTANQVIITNGGKYAVYVTCQALLDDGDEVLIPAPYWVSYPESVKLAGGVPVPIATDLEGGFKVTVDDLEGARTDKTKMLIFVSPSNPTGAVYTRDEIVAIGEWALKHGIWVMTDEIYEHLVYGDNEFHSLPVVVPEIADQTVVVNGVAKTYAMTGWRVGWLIAPPHVAKAAGTQISHAASNVANVSQRAALAAVSGSLGAVAEMRTAFDRRRLTMTRMLNEIEGVECLEPAGAFYAFPRVTGLLDRMGIATSLDLASRLLEEAQIAIVPGEAFGTPGYARFSFALGDDDLEEGLRRFRRFAG
jgi:aspartate aminotransferase